jgi:cell division protein ZapA (FtsZ GTPase activity inhibitor)
VAVEIAGEKHVLRSDVPPEYTRAVAAHVDGTIRALPGFQTLEPFRAATLAALSITDELFRAREEIRRLRGEADRRTGELADLLEAAEAAGAEKRPVRRPAGVSSSPPSWTAEEAGDATPSAAAAEPDPAPRDEGVTAPHRSEPEVPPPGVTASGAPEIDLSEDELPRSEPLPEWLEDAIKPAPRSRDPHDGEPELFLPPPE